METPDGKNDTPKRVALKQAARKALFIQALMRPDVFTVVKASEVSNISLSIHYRWLKADPEYAAAVNETIEIQTQRLEQSVEERARGIGVKQPSDVLSMFLLNSKRPDVYRPKTRVEHSGGVSVKELLLSPEEPK